MFYFCSIFDYHKKYILIYKSREIANIWVIGKKDRGVIKIEKMQVSD